jgi:hypothetical protein
MAKFKCIHTGNVFTFTAEHDIESMRKHQEYREVSERVILAQAGPKAQEEEPAAKKVGRPAKGK